jgi:hypothetical protein
MFAFQQGNVPSASWYLKHAEVTILTTTINLQPISSKYSLKIHSAAHVNLLRISEGSNYFSPNIVRLWQLINYLTEAFEGGFRE